MDYWGEATVGDVADLDDGVERPKTQAGFVAWLRARGCSDGYVSRIVGMGRAALKYAEKKSRIIKAPFVADVQSADDKRMAEPKGKPISPAELARIIDCCGDDHEHLFKFIMLMIAFMARPDAILDAEPSMWRRDEGYINLLPAGRKQTNKRRPIVPVCDSIEPWLDAWTRNPSKDKDGKVLTTHWVHYRNAPIDDIKVAWALVRARAYPPTPEQLAEFDRQMKETGPKAPKDKRRRRLMLCHPDARKISPYSIRHSMGRYLRRRRVPPDEVSIMLGHLLTAENATTTRYSPHDPDYCVHARAAVDAYFQELARYCRVRSPIYGMAPAAEGAVEDRMRA